MMSKPIGFKTLYLRVTVPENLDPKYFRLYDDYPNSIHANSIAIEAVLPAVDAKIVDGETRIIGPREIGDPEYPQPPQGNDPVLVTEKRLREALDGLRGWMAGTDHEGENVKRRLDNHKSRLEELEDFRTSVDRIIDGLTDRRLPAIETGMELLSQRLDRFAIELGGKVNARTEPKQEWFKPRTEPRIPTDEEIAARGPSPTPGLRQHSSIAWGIASQYGHILASETRDLAADIDRALDEVRKVERARR
jgi:hypothetical protein